MLACFIISNTNFNVYLGSLSCWNTKLCSGFDHLVPGAVALCALCAWCFHHCGWQCSYVWKHYLNSSKCISFHCSPPAQSLSNLIIKLFSGRLEMWPCGKVQIPVNSFLGKHSTPFILMKYLLHCWWWDLCSRIFHCMMSLSPCGSLVFNKHPDQLPFNWGYTYGQKWKFGHNWVFHNPKRTAKLVLEGTKWPNIKLLEWP